MWSVRAFVSVPQCFHHVGTCVQLLSPLIFCLVSVLSGISAAHLPLRSGQATKHKHRFFSGYQGRSNLTLKGTLHEED